MGKDYEEDSEKFHSPPNKTHDLHLSAEANDDGSGCPWCREETNLFGSRIPCPLACGSARDRKPDFCDFRWQQITG